MCNYKFTNIIKKKYLIYLRLKFLIQKEYFVLILDIVNLTS